MRLVILSDVHGNPIALDAVVADAEKLGVIDGYWVLGDLVAQGYDPAGALERLAELPNARFVMGNTDRWVMTGDWAEGLSNYIGVPADPEEITAIITPEMVGPLVIYSQGLAWTHGCLAATGWLDWLSKIPLEERTTLPDGTRMLGVHVAPGRNSGPPVEPTTTDEELWGMVSGCEAELVFVADTHWPLDRRIGEIRVVNVGSVSNPRRDLSDDVRASYAVLDADESGYEVALHRVSFDVEAVMRAIRNSNFFPNPGWLISKFADHTPAAASGASTFSDD